MGNPQKHHFVPEVYLKAFADSQKSLFQLKKGMSKINRISISQVCFKWDLYKIHSDDTLVLNKIKDTYHIEKVAFKKQENNYARLLHKIIELTVSTQNILRSEFFLFLEMLIFIKRRNPSFKNVMVQKYKGYVQSEDFQLAVQPGIEISRKVDKIDPEVYVKNYVREVLESDEKQSDMYVQRFIKDDNGGMTKLIEMLMNYKIFIYHAPFGTQFVTCDNPGFTIANEQLYQFGGFGFNFQFLFPLTPSCCLYISKSYPDENLMIYKKIISVGVDEALVRRVNLCTQQLAYERTLGYRKNSLETLLL